MCNKKTYKRFEKILENINYSRSFNTKLGLRCVKAELSKHNEICITYYDKDNTELFHIGVKKSGEIKVYNTKIGKPEIFLAIYEIESIINNKKQKKRDIILEKLFENIDEFSFQNNIFGLTQYR
jgi:predicted secreted protein